MILAVSILSLPYRVLRHSQFETAKWNAATSSVNVRLTCCCSAPSHRFPNHIVARRDSSVERLGERESIFKHFSSSLTAEEK